MYPAADPYVIAVGGSAIGIDKKNGYMYETGWETDYTSLSDDGKKWTPKPPGDFASGAGGGTTTKFAQPKWQKGVVPKKFSEAHGGSPMRTIPDISAVGDPTTGFLEGYSSQDGSKWVYGENRIGGTSLSSPLIVGMQAVAEQAAGGKSFGFANPAIYKLYHSKAYHDVTDTPYGKGKMIAHVRTRVVGTDTVVSLATAGQSKDGGLLTIKGYDTVTGVGTPTANYYKSFADLP
jgi:subtilase family serine protease